MSEKEKRQPYKKIALTLSLVLLLLWGTLGAGASLAWFADTAPEVKNVFLFADFDVKVSYLTEEGEWSELEASTELFDESALYEPGYGQVVYLKIENTGDRAFNFKTAVTVTGAETPSVNAMGQEFYLQEHLKFGVVTDVDETALQERLNSREKAAASAAMDLSNYASDFAELASGGETYLAIVVYMPEGVGNEANYRGTVVPHVELGVTVSATQTEAQ